MIYEAVDSSSQKITFNESIVNANVSQTYSDLPPTPTQITQHGRELL